MSDDTVRANATALPKSRRAALGLFASVPALAVMPATAGAASPDVDPIFAAIKRHHEAWRAFGDTCSRADDVVARNEGREVTEADEAAYAGANTAEEDVRLRRGCLVRRTGGTLIVMRDRVEDRVFDFGV